MSFSPQATWFPWLLLALMTLHSAVRHTFFNPFLGDSDEPLLFLIIAIVLWIERESIVASLLGKGSGNLWLGGILLCAGWLLYITGRLYPVMILEIWGLFCLAAGLVGMLAPREFKRSALFIAFSGTIIVVFGWITPELLSAELAQAIATVSAAVVSATFFPVVANGVILYFGPYVAEVTKACSGMNSIFSLTALSVLYLRNSLQRRLWHTAVLVACVLPVAIATNLFRVIVLVLATQYVGDGFAQGIFHETTGVFVFVVALAILALIDRLLFLFYPDSMQKVNTTDAHIPIQPVGPAGRFFTRIIAAFGRNKATRNL
ncbi:MAG: exosortase/archaeosortase family protein [Pelodictyon phaeoclathratiforme]